MLENNRYVTRTVNAEIDIRLQIFMWNLIDKLNSNKEIKADYLQVFNICKKNNKILVEHRQEVPEYKKLYELDNVKDIEVDDKVKMFVIDNVDYSKMLLAQEY